MDKGIIKSIFFCDWRLKKDKLGNYYDITLTKDVLHRYQLNSSSLTIFARVSKLNDSEIYKYTKISSEINIIEAPEFTFKNFFFKFFKNRKNVKHLINNFHLIYFRLPSLMISLLIPLKIIKRKKVLSELGGCAWDSFFNHSFLGKFIAPLMFFSTKNIIKNSFFVSYVTSNFLQKRYPTRSKFTLVSSNVVLKESFLSTLKKTNIQKSVLVLGSIGAIDVKYKGYKYSLRFVRKLINLGYKINYRIVGPGSKKQINKLIKYYKLEEYVTLIGVLTTEKVVNFLDEIDILIHFSKQEGLPRALIEAMSRGCLIFSNSVGGINELVNKDQIFKLKDKNIMLKFVNLIKNREYYSNLNIENSRRFHYNILNTQRIEFFNKYYEKIILMDKS